MSRQERIEGAYALSTVNIYQDVSMYQALGEIFYVIIQSLGQLKNHIIIISVSRLRSCGKLRSNDPTSTIQRGTVGPHLSTLVSS